MMVINCIDQLIDIYRFKLVFIVVIFLISFSKSWRSYFILFLVQVFIVSEYFGFWVREVFIQFIYFSRRLWIRSFTDRNLRFCCFYFWVGSYLVCLFIFNISFFVCLACRRFFTCVNFFKKNIKAFCVEDRNVQIAFGEVSEDQIIGFVFSVNFVFVSDSLFFWKNGSVVVLKFVLL